VALSPKEQLLVEVLLGRASELVDDATIAAETGSRDVTSAVKRLRSRVAPLGVGIHRVAGRGYLLEVRAVAPSE
jgi:DNA-binding response OmpR family regulator